MHHPNYLTDQYNFDIAVITLTDTIVLVPQKVFYLERKFRFIMKIIHFDFLQRLNALYTQKILLEEMFRVLLPVGEVQLNLAKVIRKILKNCKYRQSLPTNVNICIISKWKTIYVHSLRKVKVVVMAILVCRLLSISMNFFIDIHITNRRTTC